MFKTVQNRSHGSIYGCFVDVASYSAIWAPHVSGKKKMWGLHPFFPLSSLFFFLFSFFSSSASLGSCCRQAEFARRYSAPPPATFAVVAPSFAHCPLHFACLLYLPPPHQASTPSAARSLVSSLLPSVLEKKEEMGAHIFFSLTCGAYDFFIIVLMTRMPHQRNQISIYCYRTKITRFCIVQLVKISGTRDKGCKTNST